MKTGRARFAYAGEWPLALAGLAAVALVACSAVALAHLVAPEAVAACRQACSRQPLLTWLLNAAPWLGAGLLGGLLSGGLTFASLRAARRVRDTLRATELLQRRERPLPLKLRRALAGLDMTASVLYVADRQPLAFCAGLLRPRVVVSTGLVATLGLRELRAVLLHERHHLRRRDPLRMLVLQFIGETLFYLPLFEDLRGRCGVAAELAADQAALAEVGLLSLAGALLKLARPAGTFRLAGAVAPFGSTGARIGLLTGRGAELPRLRRSRLLFSVALAGALLLGTATTALALAPGNGTCCGQVPCTVTHH